MYTISKIQNWLNADWLQKADTTTAIHHLAFDSRRIIFPAQTLFFAIVAQRDGHDFIADAYHRGVRNFVVSKPIEVQAFSEANFLKVADVLRGLHILAARHREQFPNLKVIGIAGSNGKTTVKEWLFQLLKPDFNIVRSPASFNSQIGVPMSVWQIRAEHDLAIFEADVSQSGDMAALAAIIKPNWGIYTNLGTAHDAGFATKSEKFAEHWTLYKGYAEAVFSLTAYQNPTITEQALTDKPLIYSDYPILQTQSHVHLRIIEKTRLDTGMVLTALFSKNQNQAQRIQAQIPFTDTASIENACLCWLVLLALNIPPSVSAERLARLESIGMRLDRRAGINGSILINDSYSNDLTSLQMALDFMAQQNRYATRRTVILSDLLQTSSPTRSVPAVLSETSAHDSLSHPFPSTGVQRTVYQQVAELLRLRGITKFIGIGHDIPEIAAYLPPSVKSQFYNTPSAFLQEMRNSDFQQEIILVKGARVFQFEKIADRLAEKGHKTVLEINLDALAHNLSVFRRLLPPAVKLMAMVKASAYGNGADDVAHLLEQRGIDYLAVAYADEGIALRNAGIRLPIMVMNPEESSFEAMYRFQLEPEIYALRLLKKFSQFVTTILATENKTAEQTPVKIHLKLDTGMHRLGFEATDIQSVIAYLDTCPAIQVASIFTHLAATEAAEQDDFTHEQIRRYEAMYQTLASYLNRVKPIQKPLRHVLNSSGILRFPAYHFDMVRLGIGLYGVESSALLQKELQVVQTLKATISQIKQIAPPETVGYGRHGQVHRPSRIATISIGYADGLLRGASRGQFSVGLHGHLAPTIGNVCMDMTMIDVTDVPDAQEGDEVEIFGRQVPVQDLAKALGTIEYEVFTTLSERIKRVYYQE